MLYDYLEDGKYSNPSQQLMKDTVSVIAELKNVVLQNVILKCLIDLYKV